jgi:hypothetical protein
MADLVVITPSRGRPEQLDAMLDSVFATAGGEISVLVGHDDDDPADYTPLIGRGYDATAYRGPRMSLSGWTNHLADLAVKSANPPRYLASLGDDHRPRTKNWDLRLIEAIEALDGPGIAYGNDLLQGGHLPTAWVVSAEVVRAVGWMMLPTCEHMYVDTAVLYLGMAADRIAYVPGVTIEHLHPTAGKAAWDDSYLESNARGRYAADLAAFEAWRRDGLDADAAKIRNLKESAHA